MTNPAKPADKKPFIAVNSSPAMSGHFATLYDWSWMEGGVNIRGEEYEGSWYAEPYETGFGRYADWREANAEGAKWAEREGLEFYPATQERVDRAAENSRIFKDRVRHRAELVAQGMSLREAWDKSKELYPDLPPLAG